MTPDKIEIPIPAYFKRDRTEAIAYWDNLLKVTLLLFLLLREHTREHTRVKTRVNTHFTGRTHTHPKKYCLYF